MTKPSHGKRPREDRRRRGYTDELFRQYLSLDKMRELGESKGTSRYRMFGDTRSNA